MRRGSSRPPRRANRLAHRALEFRNRRAVSVELWFTLRGMTQPAPDRIERLDVMGSSMELFVFEPPGGSSRPAAGLVLAQHLPGGHAGLEKDEFSLATARRYAEAGYFVVAPFLFHWWPKSEPMERKVRESRDERTVADVAAASSWLRARPEVDADRVGLLGHCWGGRVAWLGAAHDPRLAAMVMFYGGRVKLAMGEGNPPPIELASRIRCPVLGIFGSEDQSPSPSDVDDYAAALAAAGVRHMFHRYEGAGHAFQNFPTPERYRPEQSEDAWGRALAFLERSLAASEL